MEIKIGDVFKVMKEGDASCPSKDSIIKITGYKSNDTYFVYEVISGTPSTKGSTSFGRSSNFARYYLERYTIPKPLIFR